MMGRFGRVQEAWQAAVANCWHLLTWLQIFSHSDVSQTSEDMLTGPKQPLLFMPMPRFWQLHSKHHQEDKKVSKSFGWWFNDFTDPPVQWSIQTSAESLSVGGDRREGQVYTHKIKVTGVQNAALLLEISCADPLSTLCILYSSYK